MKNSAVKIAALAIVISALAVSLASCGWLSGKYEASLLGQSVCYTFKGSNVTIDITLLGTVTSLEGKYKIDGDKITLTFNNEEDDASSYEGTYTFEKGEDYIKIGVVKYTKVD